MAISGQKASAVVGTYEELRSGPCNAGLMIKALNGNTGLIYVGNLSNGVSSAVSVNLAPGESLVIEDVGRFETVHMDSEIAGDGVSWLMMSA